MQHFHSIIFQDLKQLNWNAITSTSFVHSDRPGLKSRDISFPAKVRIVKAMMFPVVMYGCDKEVGPEIRLSAEELMLLNCGKDS